MARPLWPGQQSKGGKRSCVISNKPERCTESTTIPAVGHAQRPGVAAGLGLGEGECQQDLAAARGRQVATLLRLAAPGQQRDLAE
jgi:hypothetical protein